jgi:hypothetical protein
MNRILSLMALVGVVAVGGASIASAQVACSTSGVLVAAQGTVLLDRGAGFAPASVGTSVQAGNRISVQGAGNAMVDFGGARTVTVSSSSTQTLPGCGLFQDANTGAVVVGTVVVAGGIGAAIALSNDDSSTPFFPISP